VQTDEFGRDRPFEFYTDYGKYYSRLGELFDKTNGKDDHIFIVAWRHDPMTPLGSGGKTALKSLQEAQARKVTVRVLITAGIEEPALKKFNEDVVKYLQANGFGNNAVLDEQYIGHCNLHQKAVYVKSGGESFLFVGGMDIWKGLDWFDVQAEITGGAAELGRLSLEERWASVTKADFKPEFKRHPPGSDHTLVQFCRNYGKPDQHAVTAGRKYAPDGDFTYRELLTRAIGMARDFIYLEDQFFYQMGTADWSLDGPLRAAAERRVHVVVVATHRDELPPGGNDTNPGQAQRDALVSELLNSLGSNYIHLLQLNNPHNSHRYPYMHSKTWIFDDKLAVVGSANYWNRSMTCEGEFGVAVAGQWALSEYPGMPLAKGLRKKMWDRLLAKAGGKLDRTPAVTFAQDLAVLTGNQSPLQSQEPSPGSGSSHGPFGARS
jgi:phosphatidylserine/phosphatidylglycerophosphate/cardiolipin synthase-like enzyme